MQCPVCRNHNEYSDTDLHAAQFSEDLAECRICGAMWSVNHGVQELVRDPHARSFLQAETECVEGDDYNCLK